MARKKIHMPDDADKQKSGEHSSTGPQETSRSSSAVRNDLRVLLSDTPDKTLPPAYLALQAVVKERGIDANGKLSSTGRMDPRDSEEALHHLFSEEVDGGTQRSYWSLAHYTAEHAKKIGTDPTDQADFSQHWFTLSDRQEAAVKQHVHGPIFLDLGGGYPGPQGTNMQTLAEKQGYTWYINEEASMLGYGGGSEPWRSCNNIADIIQPEHMQVDHCDADIFQALIRLPDNCEGVTFALNGIDDIILPSDDFHKDLAKLLWKKVPPGGVVLTCGSTATDHFEKLGFRLVEGFKKSWNKVELWIKPR